MICCRALQHRICARHIYSTPFPRPRFDEQPTRRFSFDDCTEHNEASISALSFIFYAIAQESNYLEPRNSLYLSTRPATATHKAAYDCILHFYDISVLVSWAVESQCAAPQDIDDISWQFLTPFLYAAPFQGDAPIFIAQSRRQSIPRVAIYLFRYIYVYAIFDFLHTDASADSWRQPSFDFADKATYEFKFRFTIITSTR